MAPCLWCATQYHTNNKKLYCRHCCTDVYYCKHCDIFIKVARDYPTGIYYCANCSTGLPGFFNEWHDTYDAWEIYNFDASAMLSLVSKRVRPVHTPGLKLIVACLESGFALRHSIERRDHQFIVTLDQEEFEALIPNLHVIICNHYHPGYVTAERMRRAERLQLIIKDRVANVDEVVAARLGLTVVEVDGYGERATTNEKERYARRIHHMLESYFEGHEFPPEDCVVKRGTMRSVRVFN